MLHEHFLNIKKSKAKAGNMFRDKAKEQHQGYPTHNII